MWGYCAIVELNEKWFNEWINACVCRCKIFSLKVNELMDAIKLSLPLSEFVFFFAQKQRAFYGKKKFIQTEVIY